MYYRTNCIEAACTKISRLRTLVDVVYSPSITSVHLPAVYQLITGAPLTSTNSLRPFLSLLS
jgi:hypothetical protein